MFFQATNEYTGWNNLKIIVGLDTLYYRVRDRGVCLIFQAHYMISDRLLSVFDHDQPLSILYR